MSEAAYPLPPALQAIRWNPHVRDFLFFALTHHQLSHAYLFAGPKGSGKLEAARALAQCIVCPQHGDGSCEECLWVEQGTHPDVRFFQPESATGYLVSQARDILIQAQMSPVRATHKVYILQEAQKLGAAAANALLKTLEEPPSDVIFILIARSEDQLLPTIASRCQLLAFHPASTADALLLVQSQTGAPEAEARIALSMVKTPSEAAKLLSTPRRWQARSVVLHTLAELPQLDDWGVLGAARNFLDAAGIKTQSLRSKTTEEGLSKEEKAQEDLRREYLSSAALKKLKEADKRAETNKGRSAMMEMLAALSSVMRDVIVRAEGIDQDIVNSDASDVIDWLAQSCGSQAAVAALAAVDSAARDLSHNVSAQLACEAMLLRIKEALICPSRSR